MKWETATQLYTRFSPSPFLTAWFALLELAHPRAGDRLLVYSAALQPNGVSTLQQSYRHLAPVGKLVVYGFHSMLPRKGGRPNRLRLPWDYTHTPRFNPFSLTTRNRSVLGFNLSFLFDRSEILHEAMDQLLGWVEDDKIQPLAVHTYPFEQVAQAHRDLESGQTVGKLVLVL